MLERTIGAYVKYASTYWIHVMTVRKKRPESLTAFTGQYFYVMGSCTAWFLLPGTVVGGWVPLRLELKLVSDDLSLRWPDREINREELGGFLLTEV